MTYAELYARVAADIGLERSVCIGVNTWRHVLDGHADTADVSWSIFLASTQLDKSASFEASSAEAAYAMFSAFRAGVIQERLLHLVNPESLP